jgi:putative oxidoreductase
MRSVQHDPPRPSVAPDDDGFFISHWNTPDLPHVYPDGIGHASVAHRGRIMLAAEWEPRILSILRIVIGLLLLEHGLSKLIGFPPSNLHPSMFQLLWFAAVIETVTGLLLTVGLFTRYAAFLASGETAVAYFYSHFPRSFFPLLNGGEAAVLFSFILFYIFVAGGGCWSLDRLRR